MTSAARQYQAQAISQASPAELVDKLYGLGISAAHQGDTQKARRVLVELISSLDHEQGGEIASRLHGLYDYALREAVEGELGATLALLSDLRETWRTAVLTTPASA